MNSLLRFVAIVVLFCTACPGELENPEQFTDGGEPTIFCPSIATVESDIIVPKCGIGGCHDDSAAPQSGLNLKSPGVAARLLNVGASAACQSDDSTVYIIPGDSTGGLFLNKVLDKESGEAFLCGSQMPPAAPLTEVEQACLKAWVAQAATGVVP